MAKISVIEVPIRAAFGAEDLIKVRAVAEALTELGRALGALADGDDAAAEAPRRPRLADVGDTVRIKNQAHRFDSTGSLVGKTGPVRRFSDEYSGEHVDPHPVVRMDSGDYHYHFGYEDLEVI